MRIYFSHPHPRLKKDCILSAILQKQFLIHAEKEENITYYSIPIRVRKRKVCRFTRQPKLIGTKESMSLSYRGGSTHFESLRQIHKINGNSVRNARDSLKRYYTQLLYYKVFGETNTKGVIQREQEEKSVY